MSQIELACTSSQRKGRLSFLLFDLTDLKSCQQAASTLIAKESQLHIVGEVPRFTSCEPD